MTIKRGSTHTTNKGYPKPKGNGRPSGKRVGKSKPAKANNQLNRRVK